MSLFDEHDDQPFPIAVVRNYLSLAIRIGAPAYNAGDHRGCYEVYACTARLLVHTLKEKEADAAIRALDEALHRCVAEVDVNEQAWILRRAFDAILGQTERPGG